MLPFAAVTVALLTMRFAVIIFIKTANGKAHLLMTIRGRLYGGRGSECNYRLADRLPHREGHVRPDASWGFGGGFVGEIVTGISDFS